MSARFAMRVAAAVVLLGVGTTQAMAADLGPPRHRHLHRLRPPPGYGYGGYGNGAGPGWVDAYGPGYAPGITPGYGYIPAGAPPTIFDLGY